MHLATEEASQLRLTDSMLESETNKLLLHITCKHPFIQVIT